MFVLTLNRSMLGRKQIFENKGLVLIKNKTNSSNKHIELVHFDNDLTFRMYSTYIFKSNC